MTRSNNYYFRGLLFCSLTLTLSISCLANPINANIYSTMSPVSTIESIRIDTTENEILKVVEVMPRFPGCEEEEDKIACAQENLMAFLSKEVRYPIDAKRKRIQGTVVIQFVVDEIGKITEPEIVKDIGWRCGEESLRAVKSMPDWVPGKENGKNVAVQFSLPVKFALPESDIIHEFEMKKKSRSKKKEEDLWSQLTDTSKISPRFPGCENTADDQDQCANKEMYSFIYKNMVYPKSVKDGSAKGEVRVRFLIKENGRVANVKVSQGLNGEIDEEVLRVINSMPKWNPGAASKENLKVSISVPIKIGLNTYSSSSSAIQKAYIGNHVNPQVRNELEKAYSEIYPNDNIQFSDLSKADQVDYHILTLKAVEMTMKEFDENARLNVGTGEGEDKSEEEWDVHTKKAYEELNAFADKLGFSFDEKFEKVFDRVNQNMTRISYGQK